VNSVSSDFLRLRQVCLAAPRLAPAEAALREILGIEVVHRSDLADAFGLENAVFALNGSFIEIVAPLREDAAAARFLLRSGGRGGYIAILDCRDLERRRAAAERLGIRIAHAGQRAGAQYIQLHPRDMGAVMLEIDHHVGGEHRFGHYEWGGAHWREAVRTDVTVDLLGIELCSEEHEKLAQRWADVLGRPALRRDGALTCMELDFGELRFASTTAIGEEMLSSVCVSARDPASVVATAARLGYLTTVDTFQFCGVAWRLSRAD